MNATWSLNDAGMLVETIDSTLTSEIELADLADRGWMAMSHAEWMALADVVRPRDMWDNLPPLA
jgi:hypothetical protein